MTETVGIDIELNSEPARRGSREYEAALRSVTDASRRANREFEQSDRVLQQVRGTILRTAGSLLGAGGLAAGLRQAGQRAAEFSRSVAEVGTLLPDDAEIQAVADAAKALGVEFGTLPIDQTRAFYQAISAGAGSAAEATRILDTANRLALGGVTDVTTAVDVLTTAVNAYGLDASRAGEVSDALFVAMRAGKTTVGELASSFGVVAPLAAQTGVSIDELLAATSALTKGGISTSQAMTGLRAVLAAVAKPSVEATRLAQDLGLQFSAAAIQTQGLAGFLGELVDKTGGSTEQLAKLFGGVEALVPVLALAGQAGVDFTTILGDMDRKVGETQRAFERIAASDAARLDRVLATFSAEALELGEALLRGVVPAAELVAENMDELKDAVLFLGVAFGGARAAVLLYALALRGAAVAQAAVAFGALALQVRSVAAALALLQTAMGPAGWLVLGATAGAAAFVKFRRDLRESEAAVYDLEGALASLVGQVGSLSQEAALERVVQGREQVERQRELLRTLEQEAEKRERIARITTDPRRFREARDAAQEAQANVERQRTLVEGLERATEAAATRFRELSIAAASATKEMPGSREVRDLEEAAAKLRDTLLDAIELGIASRDELNAIRDRYDQITRILSDQNISLERRVALKREELRIEETLARVGMSATRRFVGDPRSATPSIGLATPGMGRTSIGTGAITDLLSPGRMQELARALEAVDDAAAAVARSQFDLARDSVGAAEGLLYLDQRLRILPQSLAQAVDGVLDLQFSFDQFKAARASADVPGQIAAGFGVAGGIIAVGQAIFAASENARRRAEEARENIRRVSESLSQPISGFESDLRRAVEAYSSSMDGLTRRSLEAWARGSDDLAQLARAVLSPLDATVSQAGVDAFARAAAALGDPDLIRLAEQLAGALERYRSEFLQEFEARRLAVEFGDEAAAQYRRQIELERQLAEARLLGIEESLVREVFAAEERKRLADEAERLTRDEERRLQEIADARRSFLEDLSRREAFTAGTGAQFDAADAFRRAVEAADEALASGAITQEEYARAVAQAAAEQADALRAIEDAAERAAEAIARQNDALESEISLRTLVLEGKDAEAAALRREIQFREELRRAIEAGLDETLIERLRELQDRERQAAADARAVEDLVQSVSRQAERDQQQFVRSSVQSITAMQADTLTELTRGSNTYLREISLNTAGLRGAGTVGASGGTRIEVRVTQQFYGPVTNAQQVGANTARQIAEEVDRALGQAQREAQRLGQGVGG